MNHLYRMKLNWKLEIWPSCFCTVLPNFQFQVLSRERLNTLSNFLLRLYRMFCLQENEVFRSFIK
jgi:hypothetical protein